MHIARRTDSLAGPAIARLPERIKYGQRFSDKRRQLSKLSIDSSRSSDLQRRALWKAIEDASKSSYWSERLDLTAGADPYRVLDSVQVLGRNALTQHYGEMISRPSKEFEVMSTSGSGGRPAQFYLPRNRRPIEWAYVTNAWSVAGFVSRNWRVVFRGFPPQNETGVSVNYALREIQVTTMRASEETFREVAQQMLRLSAIFLHGYPSAVTIFARWLASERPELSATVRGVFPVSEKLEIERYVALASDLPHASIVPFYGLSEKSAFAVSTRPDLGEYSFEPLYGYVEILDREGRRVETGGVGRVVTTRLEFTGAPLLRYDTGDVARVVQQQDLDKGQRLVVAELSPRRSVAYLTSADGREVPTSPGIQAGSTLFKQRIAEYQLVQDAPGQVTFLYVANGGEIDRLDGAIQSELQSKLGTGFTVRAERVVVIPAGANGKKPLVVRRFDV